MNRTRIGKGKREKTELVGLRVNTDPQKERPGGWTLLNQSEKESLKGNKERFIFFSFADIFLLF